MGILLSVETVKYYMVTLGVFLAIDMVWLLFISKSLYSKHLGYLMTKNVNFTAAGIFYLIFVAGILFFVILPALASGQWSHALLAGMFFGLVTYGTYDLTNQATIRDWPQIITIVDLLWGTFVSGSTALISFLIISKLLK